MIASTDTYMKMFGTIGDLSGIMPKCSCVACSACVLCVCQKSSTPENDEIVW